MKLQSELLGKLHKLKPRDRAWIVEQLSEQERARLLSTVASPDAAESVNSRSNGVVEPQPQSDLKSVDVVRSLSKVEPRCVAAVIKNEPAWVVVAICSAQQEAWTKLLLDALPAMQRAEVERTQLKHPRFGEALTQSVTRLALARCQEGHAPVESAFDRLVERLGSSRAKKRLTLHL